MIKTRIGLVPLLLGIIVLGCNKAPTTGVITGKVTYKGQPIKAGNVTFHTEEKGSYNASLALDGTFSISGVPPGPVTVTVYTEFLNPNTNAPDYSTTAKSTRGVPNLKLAPAPKQVVQGKGAKITDERRAADQAAGMRPMSYEEMAARFVRIPLRYSRPTTSDLKFTVEPGKQEKDFDLKD
jgi:hypothetical protein